MLRVDTFFQMEEEQGGLKQKLAPENAFSKPRNFSTPQGVGGYQTRKSVLDMGGRFASPKKRLRIIVHACRESKFGGRSRPGLDESR